jgi:hypothetical protein
LPGSRLIKQTLVEVAWAASKTKGTYLKSKYRKLAPRIGKKRALVAIGHKILISIYHVLKKKEPYKEMGENYLEQLNKGKIAKHLCQRLEDLGYNIAIVAKTPAQTETAINE